MINLENTTFIIPICIESEDRKKNAEITLNYLCKHLQTNIIIFEYDSSPKLFNIIKNLNTNSNICHNFIENNTGNNVFHRTKLLNEMLALTETEVVVNYDIDIILKPEVYKKCSDLILNGADLVYPYFWGNSQYQINYSGRDKLINHLSVDCLSNNDINLTRSEYGHCQFFNTKSYIQGGMENEDFISYGPEDQERGYRFKKLGYNVIWSDDFVYHIEHTRGNNSSSNNPMMQHNNKLFEKIKNMSLEQLKSYYKEINYIKKYKRN
jgi:hypothetical protein